MAKIEIHVELLGFKFKKMIEDRRQMTKFQKRD